MQRVRVRVHIRTRGGVHSRAYSLSSLALARERGAHAKREGEGRANGGSASESERKTYRNAQTKACRFAAKWGGESARGNPRLLYRRVPRGRRISTARACLAPRDRGAIPRRGFSMSSATRLAFGSAATSGRSRKVTRSVRGRSPDAEKVHGASPPNLSAIA